jgi:hypothetical protein
MFFLGGDSNESTQCYICEKLILPIVCLMFVGVRVSQKRAYRWSIEAIDCTIRRFSLMVNHQMESL